MGEQFEQQRNGNVKDIDRHCCQDIQLKGGKMSEDDSYDVTVNQYSNIVNGKERFGIEVVVGGDAVAAAETTTEEENP